MPIVLCPLQSKQLERMEQFCPLHLRRELSGIRQRGLQYSAWSEEQRQEHCAKLREAMTALAWCDSLSHLNSESS